MASLDGSAVVRPSANFLPSLWGDLFASFSLDHKEVEKYTKEISVLKEEVRNMVTATDCKQNEKINLIDTLERLGVSYHFEKEIENQLEQIFKGSFCDQDYDLYTTAIGFRVFRQHGYNIPCDVFNKLKDSNGEFKKSITSDVMGMVSLYEAAHLRVRGEESLDMALAFTTVHLKSMTDNLSPRLAKYVLHALEQPLHVGVPRLEARHYIHFYQQGTSRNESLLRLAKLDFNLVQLLHKHELSQAIKWWKRLDLASKLPYARDRAVEAFFWAMCTFFEPHFAVARSILFKFISFMSVLDDTFDAHGTPEELRCFTDAVERWDIGAVDQLPDYMKPLYTAILDTFEQFQVEVTKQGEPSAIYVARDAMKQLVQGYHVEAKWSNERCLPTYEEYIDNGLLTSTAYVFAVASILGMGELAPMKALDWIQTQPKILTAGQIIARLTDDISSYEEEQARGDISAIECLMKQHGLTQEQATVETRKKIDDAWKVINKELLRPAPVSMNVLTTIVNVSRTCELNYKYNDGYTHPEMVVKDYIISMFVDPIVP